jgi:murein L,D-transpeptidase YcbB/YkuD
LVAGPAAGCAGGRPEPPARDGVIKESPFAPSIAAALSSPRPESVDVFTLRRVYAERRNAPLWIDDSGRVDARAEAIASVLEDAAADGLEPPDYHAGAIRRRLSQPGSGDPVSLELLLSDGAIRYAVHQANGVRPPAAGDGEAWLQSGDPDVGTIARELADAPDPHARLRAFAPAHEPYRRLRTALALHRRIEAEGGWSLVPAAVLRPGMRDAAVAVLRRRLAVSGDLTEGADSSPLYDDAVTAAVRRFQWRHGVGADGVVGERTLAALNVPVGRRVADIVVNMERWRWFGRELDPRYVKVNVPDYSLELAQHGSVVLTMPVVVGKPDWRTPVINGEIRRIIFNPSWFVPPSIAEKEMLPKARADRGYFAREGVVVRHETSSAAPGEPGASDRPARRVVRLRQAPGPRNPLGRVKFELPNPLGIYLHDTPARGSFTRSNRALSHGCIRLRDPLDLADALLAGTDGWDEQRRKQILSTWRTQSLAVPRPVPIYVTYETAWVDELGVPHFREDVYERDPTLYGRLPAAGRAPLATRSSRQRTPGRAAAGP